jgi:hypothetical protein
MFFNHIEFTKKIEKSLQLTSMKQLSRGSAITLLVQEHIKCGVTSYYDVVMILLMHVFLKWNQGNG